MGIPSLPETIILVFSSLLVPPTPVGGPLLLLGASLEAHAEAAEVAVEEVEAETRTRRLRVLSYNIHHGRGLDGRIDLERIARVITEARPDLVVLNEVDRDTRRSGEVDQPAEIARRTGMGVVFEKNIAFQGGEYGNAVLTRLPVLRHVNHPLPSFTEGEQRGCLEVVVDLGEDGESRPLRFLGTHLDYRPEDTERLASADLIARRFAAEPGMPTVLAGDLNDEPDSRTLRRLETLFGKTDGVTRPTYPAGKPAKQIDYVLHAPKDGVTFVEARVVDAQGASDHRPLLVVLDVRLD